MMPNSSHGVPNDVFLCVSAIVEAMLIKIVFFYSGNERFLHFRVNSAII